jgi:hypothetical protein
MHSFAVVVSAIVTNNTPNKNSTAALHLMINYSYKSLQQSNEEHYYQYEYFEEVTRVEKSKTLNNSRRSINIQVMLCAIFNIAVISPAIFLFAFIFLQIFL